MAKTEADTQRMSEGALKLLDSCPTTVPLRLRISQRFCPARTWRGSPEESEAMAWWTRWFGGLYPA